MCVENYFLKLYLNIQYLKCTALYHYAITTGEL